MGFFPQTYNSESKIFREDRYSFHLNNFQDSGNSNKNFKSLVESLCHIFHCLKTIKVLTHLSFIFKAVFKSLMIDYCHCMMFLGI